LVKGRGGTPKGGRGKIQYFQLSIFFTKIKTKFSAKGNRSAKGRRGHGLTATVNQIPTQQLFGGRVRLAETSAKRGLFTAL